MSNSNFNMDVYEKLVLDKLQFVVVEKLSNYITGEENFDRIFNCISDQIIFRLCMAVAAKEVELTPSSWWQHFKKDCMPKWFVRRYPVKYNKTKVVVNCKPHKFDSRYRKHHSVMATYPMFELETSVYDPEKC